MSKKLKALQITALLTAVSGATLVAGASDSPVQAAEKRVLERCWDRKNSSSQTNDRLRGCLYEQYGLKGDDSAGDPPGGGGGGVNPQPGPGPQPGPYGP